jgi:hypothetical protein
MIGKCLVVVVAVVVAVGTERPSPWLALQSGRLTASA